MNDLISQAFMDELDKLEKVGKYSEQAGQVYGRAAGKAARVGANVVNRIKQGVKGARRGAVSTAMRVTSAPGRFVGSAVQSAKKAYNAPQRTAKAKQLLTQRADTKASHVVDKTWAEKMKAVRPQTARQRVGPNSFGVPGGTGGQRAQGQ